MYDGLRDPARWTLPAALEFQASRRGADLLVRTVQGEALTYAQAARDAEQVAGWFAARGVHPGDFVAVMLPSRLDFVRVWLGLGRLGAVMVPLNPELSGAFLEHQLENSGAALLVTTPDRLPQVEAVASRLTALKAVVLSEAPAETPSCATLSVVRFTNWSAAAAWTGPLPRPADIACVIYTSGTTGPAKGVLMPHAHCFLFGLGTIDNLGLTPEDRYYIVLPLFHANGLLMQLGAVLIAGAGAVLRDRFSASAWLSDVREHGCTMTNVLGAVAAFVLAQPPSPADREHRLRLIGAAPNPAENERAFRRRFGVKDVIGMYGMTEVNIPLYGERGRARPGRCGRVYSRYFELEIRDPDTDAPLPAGAVGEIMVRPKIPFGFMTGYHRMPDQTVAAWRNLWFHTGDAGLMARDGYVTFVDRIKDCIRRRGENISSFEVERAVAQAPGVKEVAAYAVPSGVQGGEDEIMLAVVPEPGANPSAEAIAAWADKELPRYARPRFIEIFEALPKTPTEKVRKAELRKRGTGPRTWDREGLPEGARPS